MKLNQLYNMDCMDLMKAFPDKYFDLAIVDPPYGDASGTTNYIKRGGGIHRERKITRAGMAVAGKIQKKMANWDFAPPQEYFDELFRVSKNQIIWGGNYFDLPPTRCFLVWKKFIPENFSMAMCEYAWTSFKGNAKLFERAPQGTAKDPRIHPTQKPVDLYVWQLQLFAKKGDKILDTHGGSLSSGIACEKLGYQWIASELDSDYCRLANERLEAFRSQISIFDLEETL